MNKDRHDNSGGGRKLTHSELLAARLTTEQALAAERLPVTLILHNIRSLYNVGSIFRTADSALAAEVVLCGFTPHPPREEIRKTALGADESVPWRYEKSIKDAIARERAAGKTIVALELAAKSRDYSSLEARDFPLAIVLGNEITGVDDDILELCDFAIEIPMRGVKHSLNVAVSTGIALYEAARLYNLYNENANNNR
ncbi:MAG: RNA methyltransferase [Chloroflexota bacterium]